MNHRRIAFALGLALSAHAAQAKSVEEILRDRGVISEAEAREAAESKPVVGYKPADGLSVGTADGDFKLTIGGRVQAQYDYAAIDHPNGGPTGDTSSFRIRRAYAWMKGNAFTRDLTYKLQADWKDPQILDAWLNYRVRDELQIEAGQDIIPFARQELNSSATLQLVERSPTEIYYRPSYDTGAMVWGKVSKGLFYYNLGAFNGLGANRRRAAGSPNLAFNARVTVNPLGDFPMVETDIDGTPSPLVSVSAAYFMNRLRYAANTVEANASDYVTGFLSKFPKPVTAFSDVVDVGIFEVDGAFKWMGLYLQAEYYNGSARTKTAADAAGKKYELKSDGFYVQGGYMVLPRTLELAARYSAWDPNTDSAVKHDEKTEIAGAVNYYFYRHGFKVQLEVGTTQSEALKPGSTTAYDKLNDIRTRLLGQVIF